MQQRRRKKRNIARAGVPSQIWLPEAYHFASLLGSNGIRYAIFGAGALAVHRVMVRPTIDIDLVVDDYKKAVALLQDQSGIIDKDLKKEKDGIQVADFHFKSGLTIQIWDNNLYSLPMTDDSWSRITARIVPGYELIQSISMADLIISKVGRYTQQKSDSQYEAEKNVKDIVSTMATLLRPDIKYATKRLKEGARRETSSNSSPIHPLHWYFVREVEVYKKVAESLGLNTRIQSFISEILLHLKTRSVEYWLLHSLRKNGSIQAFQTNFMLDQKVTSSLLRRWGLILQVSGDNVSISSKAIQQYVETLEPEIPSEYAKRLIYSGKPRRRKSRSWVKG
jgi:hypothetical protein